MLMDDQRRVARILVHDLGKYIARTARNVLEGEWTPEMVEMLWADLYDLKGERASEVFLRLAPRERPFIPEWRSVRQLLLELDGMESALKKGETRVIHAAAEKALQVERLLRVALKRLEEPSSP